MSDINLIISATDNASGPLGNINQKLAGVTTAANTAGGGFTNMGGKIKAALGVAAGAFAVFQGITVINDRIGEMDELAKRARAVGSATEEGFAQFQVASQLLAEGGLSAQEADRAFNNLQLRLAAGANGNKAYGEIMAKLGDSVFDAKGQLKEAPALFEAVGQAVQDGTLSVDEASKVLGQRVGPKIVGIFEDMAAKGVSTKDALADVAANTNIVPLEAATNAEAFGDTMERINQVLGRVMTEAITPLLPLLVKLAEEVLANLPAIVEKVTAVFQALSPVFSLIGTILTDLVFPILSKVFEVLGKVAEAVTPLAEKAIPLLTDAFEKVVEIVETVIEKVMGVIESVQEFGDTISSITGGVKDKVGDMAAGVGESVTNMTNNMVDKAKEAKDGVLGFFQDMYQKAVGGSIIPDMVDEILVEFDRQKEGMVEKTRETVREVLASFRELGSDMPSVLQDALAGGMGGLSETNLSDIDFFAKKMEEFAKSEKDATDQARRGAFALKNLDMQFERGALTVEKYTKMYKHLGIEQESLTSRAMMSAQQISDGFGQMASTIGGTMTDVIMGTKNGFEALGDIVKSTIRMIVQTLVQNFIVNPLIKNIQASIMGTSMGGMGGGLGGLFSAGGLLAGGSMAGLGILGGVGMLLGGFLADGGPAKANTPYVVGERGPELFVPRTSGTVVSNEQMNAMGGQGDLTVNFNLSAIDTQTGTEFLLENKRVITGVVQEAYRRRGAQGPLG